MAKIYTKTGDLGTTSLIGGRRVPKFSLQVGMYGEIDELNSHIGLLYALDPQQTIYPQIQEQLFLMGNFFALDFSIEQLYNVPLLEPTFIQNLERKIDEIQCKLPPLTSFILPGGTVLSAQIHIARCVCRRCERLMAQNQSDLCAEVLPAHQDFFQEHYAHNLAFLNRLSDLFFVLARFASL